MMNAIKTFDLSHWSGPVDSSISDQAIEALEHGSVIALPMLAFTFLPEEQRFLSTDWSDKQSKNIALRASGELKGAVGSVADMAALKAVVQRYAKQSHELVAMLFPSYVPNLTVANTSFRPFEVETRTSSYRKDDTRLHADAFPSNATQALDYSEYLIMLIPMVNRVFGEWGSLLKKWQTRFCLKQARYYLCKVG
ncbi:Kdo hydroxylase family protein [Methylotenera sp.]|uniref:Kdo hydroxylase family protein n=1 Tax=Methylotenera sp. TaxID=2051956 RepID=UPI00248A7C78|nr:Kdo hydroxylase family protein [Methylotenera sp.]MDI1297877.1 Kdo hydroxylase family protein [Methylotenera sp.]